MSKSIEMVRNDNLRVLDPMCRMGRGFCKYTRGEEDEHDEHEDLIWGGYKSFVRQNCECVAGATFLNGKKPDLYITDFPLVVEFCVSETIKDCLIKCKDYPVKRVWIVKDGQVFFFDNGVNKPFTNVKPFNEVFP